MKTLVVFFALVSLAIAAPALHEDRLEDIHHGSHHHLQSHPRIPELVKREKKSTLEQSTSTVLNTGVPNTEVQHEAGAATFTTRNVALKKPLIVKKKFGYSLYRDSEEEKAHADSNETCGRQVKVKLCEEKEKLRSSAHIDNVHSSDEDMKHSIKMAKEAVENLQRDLMKMEHKNAAMKMAHDTESDTDLHEDIEVARKALDHIHTNFDNVETVRLRATASKDSETMHDVHITLAKSEEERMAQWKDAVENIHKNLEIVRNIEDSFKEANNQESLLHLDQAESASTIHNHKLEDDIINEEHRMRNAEPLHLDTQTVEKELKTEDLLNKETTDHTHMHHAREEQHVEDDMNPAASDVMEMKAVDIENHHTLRSENHKHHHEHEKSVEEKLEEHVTHTHQKSVENNDKIHEDHELARDSELKLDVASPMDFINQQHSSFMKDTEDLMEKPQMKMDKHSLFKSSENIADTHTAPLTDSVKLLTPLKTEDHQRSTLEKDNKVEQQVHQKNILDGSESFTTFPMKSAEHAEKDKKLDDITSGVLEKTADNSGVKNRHSTNFEIKLKAASPLLEIEQSEKKDQEQHVQKLHNIVEQTENSMKAADHLPENHMDQKIDYNESEHKTSLSGMKSAENNLHHHLAAITQAERDDLPAMRTADTHLHRFESMPSNRHWSNEHRHMHIMKAAEEFKKDFHGNDRMRNSHLPDNHHMHTMKAAEEFKKDSQGIDHMRNSHLPEHHHMHTMKAAEEFKKDFHGIDHMRNSPLSEHFNPSKMGVTHDFEMSEHTHQHEHVPSRHHHNLMSHSKMHDMSLMPGGAMSSNFHPSMREAMDGLGSDHTFRWMPSHESARNAYGAGLSGSIGASGSAIGVFPEANSGPCGIPILLSCSPSVVSGSLAKAHAIGSPGGYASPSYRTEDDFGFHNKRDITITKSNDIRNSNVLRSPSIVKQKTGTIVENKL